MIPKVVEVVLKKRPLHTHPWKMPKNCPACGTPVVHVEGEVAVRCPNKRCVQQRIRRLAHFVSRNAMDIEHMGERVVEQLVQKGLITHFADIFKLTKEDLAQLEGFKEKSIHNLLTSIDKACKVTLARFIFALGVPHIGEETAEELARLIGDVRTLCKMKEEDFLAVEGVGEKTAKSVADYFQDPIHMEEIHSLLEYITPEVPKISHMKGHPFFGKTFVLTGTLSEFTRTQASELIKERGGRVSSSVTKETDFVLAGVDPGSKLDKAQKLHVHILYRGNILLHQPAQANLGGGLAVGFARSAPASRRS